MESIIRTTLESFEQNAAFEKLKALTGFSFTAEPLKPVWQPNRFKKAEKQQGMPLQRSSRRLSKAVCRRKNPSCGPFCFMRAF
ncbi:hypothetical protein [Allobaculum sp. Allo2]|uniref:hypothetical protein n=1 Tax=Allobaculum sp. Allo2 TaxID=2853432 RepID=UPI001F61C398|nr:hypothetical protein [Allobaculum sp. Allo2]UNT92321.1 hypothetical protein KWG61_08905 [Allobaculum sp. Allo2]